MPSERFWPKMDQNFRGKRSTWKLRRGSLPPTKRKRNLNNISSNINNNTMTVEITTMLEIGVSIEGVTSQVNSVTATYRYRGDLINIWVWHSGYGDLLNLPMICYSDHHRKVDTFCLLFKWWSKERTLSTTWHLNIRLFVRYPDHHLNINLFAIQMVGTIHAIVP